MKVAALQRPARKSLALSLIFLMALGSWNASSVKGSIDDQSEGDAGKIAFSRRDENSEIYVMNADGSNQTRLTNNTTDDEEPAWSQDGQKIAFVCNGFEICMMNSDGSGLIQLTSDSFEDTSPAWSPDGQKIAFGSKRTGRSDIYVIDVNSGELTRLTFDETWDSNPTWSPDGEQIAFGVSPPYEEAYYGTVIYIMSASGRDLRQLTSLPSGAYANHYSPAWSPDGTLIAFGAFFDDGSVWSGIYRIRTDGHPLSLTQLTQGSDYDYYVSPAWSPDGQQIAFDSNGDIYTINLSNGDQKQLTNTPDQDSSPSWTSGQVLPSLEELLARKEAVIPDLKNVIYQPEVNYKGALSAYNEDAAKNLVNKLKELQQTNPDTISPEQLKSFSRLVMQEETLAKTLRNYSVVNDDFAETLVDSVAIFTGLGLMARNLIRPGTSMADSILKLIAKTLTDFLKLCQGNIQDDEVRLALLNGFIAASEYIEKKGIGLETLIDVLADGPLKELVSQIGLKVLTFIVQPTIDQGVRSVEGSPGEIWQVGGTDELARLQLEHIEAISKTESETAHSQYQQFDFARRINALFIDAADFASLTPLQKYAKFVQFSTRAQQILLIDMPAAIYSFNSLNCIVYVSDRAGELAFQSEQPTADCANRTSKTSAAYLAVFAFEGDKAAWQAFRPELQDDLADYKSTIQAVQTAMQSGDKAQVEQAAEQLATAQAEVNESTTIAMNLIMPPAGEVWAPETQAMAQQIVNLDLNAIGLQIGIVGYLSDPTSQEAKDYVNQYAQDLLDNAIQLEQSLPLTESFGSNSTAVPVIVSAPSELEGVVGQPLSIDVKILNAGSATLSGTTLTASSQDTVLASVDAPVIEANQSAELTVSFTPSAEGQSVVLLTVDDRQRTDFRFIQLTVKSAPPTLVPTSTPSRSTPFSAPCSCLPAAALLPLVFVIRKRKKKV